MEIFKTINVLESDDCFRIMFPHKKVGILGGTFNPIHNGHVDMATKIKDEFALDSVMLLPCGNPPHKGNISEREMASATQRYHMAALCAYNNKGICACDIEIKREGYTYTIDTMEELAKKEPETDFYYIIGSDTLFELETWKKIAKLCKMIKFICVKRREHSGFVVSNEIVRLKEIYGVEITSSKYEGLYVSSSYIRERISKGKSISEFVPECVEEYINAHGLYKTP